MFKHIFDIHNRYYLGALFGIINNYVKLYV